MPFVTPNTNPMRLIEVGMIASDIICIEIRDPLVVRGSLVTLGTPYANGSSLGWRLDSSVNEWGKIQGVDYDQYKVIDKRPQRYLNRQVSGNPAAWNTANSSGWGGRTVTAVSRKAWPDQYAVDCGYDQSSNPAFAAPDLEYAVSTFRYLIYLKLSGALAQGTYTITFPTNMVKNYSGSLENMTPTSTSFVWDDTVARSKAISIGHVGWRAGDKDKRGNLYHKVPWFASEGQIDYSAFTSFQIIDALGVVQYTGSITQALAANSAELGSGFVVDVLAMYPSVINKTRLGSTDPTKWHKITGYTNASQGVFTFQGTLVNDQYVFGHCGIPNSGINQLLQVKNVSGSTCKLWNVSGFIYVSGTYIDTSWWPTFDTNYGKSAQSFDGNYLIGAYIIETYETNPYGTGIWQFDFSSWVPNAPGKYRVRIPGLGVSRSFTVDDAVWYRVARNGGYGEYCQRMGDAWDGRGGTITRPAIFKHGVNDFTVYKSTLPVEWTSYATWFFATGVPRPDVTEVTRSPFITATPELTPGDWANAGDKDSGLVAQSEVVFDMLDLYEMMPLGTRDHVFGSTLVEIDPTFYSGCSDMAGLFASAMWFIHGYKTMQNNGTNGFPDGSVQGGVTYSDPDYVSAGYNDPSTSDQTVLFSASWHPMATISPALGKTIKCASYGPSIWGNYIAAALFAKASCIFSDRGKTTQATAYAGYAQRAWDWAESMFSNSTARDAWFRPITTQLGMTTTQHNALMTAMLSDFEAPSGTPRNTYRRNAACAMFRMTGTTTYRTIGEADYLAQVVNWPQHGAVGAQDLLRANNWSAAALSADLEGIIRDNNKATGTWGGGPIANHEAIAVKKLRGYNWGHGPWNGNDGFNIEEWGMACARAWNEFDQEADATNAARCLRALVSGLQFLLGCNAHDRSYIAGIGQDNIFAYLYPDFYYSSMATPPPGLVCYGTTGIGYPVGWNENFTQRPPWNGSIIESPITGSVDATWGEIRPQDKNEAREYEPYRFCVPNHEFLAENPKCIGNMEFTVDQNMMGPYLLSAFLHGFDGLGSYQPKKYYRIKLGA